MHPSIALWPCIGGCVCAGSARQRHSEEGQGRQGRCVERACSCWPHARMHTHPWPPRPPSCTTLQQGLQACAPSCCFMPASTVCPCTLGPARVLIHSCNCLARLEPADVQPNPLKALVAGVQSVGCGVDFTVWLAGGKLYSAGMGQYGVLGDGIDHSYNAKDCGCPCMHACPWGLACLPPPACPSAAPAAAARSVCLQRVCLQRGCAAPSSAQGATAYIGHACWAAPCQAARCSAALKLGSAGLQGLLPRSQCQYAAACPHPPPPTPPHPLQPPSRSCTSPYPHPGWWGHSPTSTSPRWQWASSMSSPWTIRWVGAGRGRGRGRMPSGTHACARSCTHAGRYVCAPRATKVLALHGQSLT